jgi:ubiquitin-activating enzyme E1
MQCWRITIETNANAKDRGEFHVDELSETIVKAYARHAAIELQPLCTFFGGFIAHEIIKFTGKYTPVNGWFFHDALEALPSSALSEADRTPMDSRYDNTIQVFGRSFQVSGSLALVIHATNTAGVTLHRTHS